MSLNLYLRKILSTGQLSGLLLIFCVMASLILANSGYHEAFNGIQNVKIGISPVKYSLIQWINDGLMAIFFLLVGLEIKHEVLHGALSSFKKANLPVVAALGGMLIPAFIFLLFNVNGEHANAWAIPMATDIAFSLAVLSAVAKGVPSSIRIFLSALAIADDLGAILVIAIFYSSGLHWEYLLLAAAITVLLLLLNYFKVDKIICYLIPGIFLWYFIHHSGIHATVAGVILAFTIPTKSLKRKLSPLKKLEHQLQAPVQYFIMPVFALFNTNIQINADAFANIFSPLGYGIFFGLVLGKFLGIFSSSYIAVKTKISTMPVQANWRQMAGAALLAGIGFTMSIFIALLSIPDETGRGVAKLSILLASLTAAGVGTLLLKKAESQEV